MIARYSVSVSTLISSRSKLLTKHTRTDWASQLLKVNSNWSLSRSRLKRWIMLQPKGQLRVKFQLPGKQWITHNSWLERNLGAISWIRTIRHTVGHQWQNQTNSQDRTHRRASGRTQSRNSREADQIVTSYDRVLTLPMGRHRSASLLQASMNSSTIGRVAGPRVALGAPCLSQVWAHLKLSRSSSMVETGFDQGLKVARSIHEKLWWHLLSIIISPRWEKLACKTERQLRLCKPRITQQAAPQTIRSIAMGTLQRQEQHHIQNLCQTRRNSANHPCLAQTTRSLGRSERCSTARLSTQLQSRSRWPSCTPRHRVTAGHLSVTTSAHRTSDLSRRQRLYKSHRQN